jgi:transcriptional regulator with XRE-family HTH domain
MTVVIQPAVEAKSLSEAIVRARRASKLLGKDVATRLGISATRVSQIERAGLNLNLNTIIDHARASGYVAELVLRPLDPNLELIVTVLDNTEQPQMAAKK